MPVTCKTCRGEKYKWKGVRRSWWQVLLLHPQRVRVLCEACNGIGIVQGSPEEEREVAAKRHREQEEQAQRKREIEARRQAKNEAAAQEARIASDPVLNFKKVFDEFLAEKEHGFVLTNVTAKAGAAVIPDLQEILNKGLHSPKGRAVVIALGNTAPELALPLIEQAFGSMYNATRYYAAEYLANHPTEAAKQLARKRLEVETHETARKALVRCLEAK